ncbi:MAG TPA: lysophospholipid acyltransferase family protein [Symbiobacteriaceae bacterium]
MWLYGFGKVAVGIVYRVLYRVRVEGTENIPADGGVIISGNHMNGNDPLFVGISATRKLAFMAKEEIFKIPFVSFLARGVGAFPVKRGQPDRAALKRTLDLLEQGGGLGIFPEGTRNRSGKLGKAEPGTAYLALKSGVPVIPVGISSTYKWFSPVVIKYGKPVDLEPYRTGKLTSDVLEDAGETIMAAIGAELVPPVAVRVVSERETADKT